MRYVLGPGPNGSIHCAIGRSESMPAHVALVVHSVDPNESAPIGSIDTRYSGRSPEGLQDVTEIWFQNTRSVDAIIETLVEIKELMACPKEV